MSAREPEPAPHYMAVTADNLETPVAVFDDLDAMCRLVNLYPLHKKRPGR